MPRGRRSIQAGEIYHVLNRAVGRATVFHKAEDYEAYIRIIQEGLIRQPVAIYDYCVMPNHWHFVTEAENDEQISDFFQWTTMTHAQRYRTHYRSVGEGHVYQARFKSFPVETEEYLIRLFRYVERNPLRAGLVERAEQWRWSGLWDWAHGANDGIPLSPWPIPRPNNWIEFVNQPQTEAEVDAIRKCIRRGIPYGSEQWVLEAVERLGLQSTQRPIGRPPKPK
jgi:putative transposase